MQCRTSPSAQRQLTNPLPREGLPGILIERQRSRIIPPSFQRADPLGDAFGKANRFLHRGAHIRGSATLEATTSPAASVSKRVSSDGPRPRSLNSTCALRAPSK